MDGHWNGVVELTLFVISFGHNIKLSVWKLLLFLATSLWWARDGKGKVFYGQEPPSGESTTTECGFNYELLAVIYWGSPMGSH